MCLCSATPMDWNLVSRALSSPQNYEIFGCFGVHPWHAQSVSVEDTTWTNTLSELLIKFPSSIVGEIGLDKAKAVASFKSGHQQKLFEIQFNIASVMRRPVNLHCVRAHGWLLEFLRVFSEDETKFFPPILCHSWTGSTEMVNSLLKLPHKVGTKIWFGFSGAINLGTSSKKLAPSVAAIPSDRIVLESDYDCCTMQEPGILDIMQYVANVRGWSYEFTVQTTTQNSLNFLNGTV